MKLSEITPENINFPAVMKWTVAFFAAQAAAVTTGPMVMIWILVMFMGIDWVTGFTAAWIRGDVSSEIGAKGLAKKGQTLLLILTVHLAEKFSGYELHLELWGSGGYIVNEVVSIIENVAKSGVDIPSPLVNGIKKVKAIVKAGVATPEEIRALAEEGEREKAKTANQ